MRGRVPGIVFGAMTSLALIAGPAACGSSASAAGHESASVDSYSIKLDQTTLPAGKVQFSVTNHAAVKHEFVLLRTDTADDQIPVDAQGAASEDGKLGEVSEFAGPNVTKIKTFTLTSGHYVVLCNIPTHYQQGMHAAFTVQ